MPSPVVRRVTRDPAAPAETRRTGFRVFIDFDNTITIGDVLDGIIERFAVGDAWRSLETAWDSGAIGARACLDGQLRSLRGEWADYARHLDGVQLDPGFQELCAALARDGIELTIVSDNFDRFIGYILQRHGLAHLPCYANHLEISGDRVVPSFPYSNPACPGCAHCKKTHFLPPNDDGRTVIYIGDGRSDLCPARHAGFVFAKATLLRTLRAEKIPCVAFDTLSDVTAQLPTLLHENRI